MSEYSMGELDFLRYNEWLKQCETWSAYIDSNAVPSLEMIQHFFAGLNVLYKSWRPIISSEKIIKELDDAISNSKHKKRLWENSIETGIPFNKKNVLELCDLLDSIHRKLLYMKQITGLGIIVKKTWSVKEKIKRGIHGDKKFINLPAV